MSLALLLAIILLVVIIVCLIYAPPAPFTNGGKIIGCVCALLLFLIAVGVIHL